MNAPNSNLTVGILGGMGPYATHAFFGKILTLTPAKKDWDHLRLIIDNNPHIPSRSRAYLFNETSPTDQMLECCQKLERYPVDIIALPCNSATFFLREIESLISTPILNIVEVTAARSALQLSQGSKVAVLGGNIVYREKLYKSPLERSGLEFIDHNETDQETIINFIEDIKLNGKISDMGGLDHFVQYYIKRYRPDGVVLGCTEFGCLNEMHFSKSVLFIDSTTELASEVVRLSLNGNAAY